jgi:hypothetical protein
LVSGGSGTIASEALVGAHVLSIPAATYLVSPIVPISCESSAPPDQSGSDTSGPVSVPGFLEVQGLSCGTNAFDDPGMTGAEGTGEAIQPDLAGELVTAESAHDSTSSVHALGQVTSRALAELDGLGLLEGAITANLVRASASAIVEAGDPGAASAVPEWEITGFRVLSTEYPISGPGPVSVPPDTLSSIGVVSITAGTSSSMIAPDGSEAQADVEALHVVLESGLEISIGAASVSAFVMTVPNAVQATTFGRIKKAFLPPEAGR